MTNHTTPTLNTDSNRAAVLDLSGTPLVAPAPVPSNGDTICLVGAKDAQQASFDELCAVPLPATTYRERKDGTLGVSYQPVAYGDFATAARSIFANTLNAEPLSECYALARNGQQMFGRIVFPWDERRGLQVCLRSSYDQSIANQVAGGTNTFICANGQLTGEAMFSLKHTTEVGNRLPEMIAEMASRAGDVATKLVDRLDRWSDVDMGDDLFYAYVGILRGRDIITPTIANSAIRYWKACRSGQLHAEHAESTLANAYQAVSGGLHRVAPSRAFLSFGGTDAVTESIAQSGGSMQGVPAFDLQSAIREF